MLDIWIKMWASDLPLCLQGQCNLQVISKDAAAIATEPSLPQAYVRRCGAVQLLVPAFVFLDKYKGRK